MIHNTNTLTFNGWFGQPIRNSLRPCRIALLATFLLAGTLLLTGCAVHDYYRAEFYRVSIQPAAVGSPLPDPREHLIESIRSTLKELGFKEWTGKQRTFWSKHGAYIEWRSTLSGELELKVSAFGGKSDLRESEQVELELLHFVTGRGDLKVTRFEPLAEDWK